MTLPYPASIRTPQPWNIDIPLRDLQLREEMMAITLEARLKHDDWDLVVTETTFERSRDPDEGSLWEPEEPHEIRPPADSGISFLENDDGLHIDVQKAPDSQKYEAEACHVKSPHMLCLSCRDVLNYYCVYVEHVKDLKRENEHQNHDGEERNFLGPIRRNDLPGTADVQRKSIVEQQLLDIHTKKSSARMRNAVIHHFNLLSLVARAGEPGSCFLCKTLLQCLEEQVPDVLKRHHSLKSHRIETYWPRRQSMEKRSTLQFVLIDMHARRTQWNNTHIYRLHTWPASVETSASVTAARRGDTWFGVTGSTASSASKNSARSWLRTCVENEDGAHAICNAGIGVSTPTRLLEIVDEGTKVKLISNAVQNRDLSYLTLSHCWGVWGAKKNPILKRSNVDSLQCDGLAVAKLPKTFRHAIKICGWFKKAFIWIDSLCIIQDSEEDWRREAAAMDKTYKHAFLNISADLGDDSRDGCFVKKRSLADVVLMHFSAPRLHTSFKLMPDPHFLFEWMKTSPSFSRAWIHRERQLSPRILHLTATELVWECCGSGRTCFRSELFPEGAPFDRLFNRDHKLQATELVDNPYVGPYEVLVQWQEMCENLSRKHLSQPTDMPIVLSGITKEFKARLPPGQEFVAGLWRCTLPESLLWKSADDLDDEIPPDVFIAPSWS